MSFLIVILVFSAVLQVIVAIIALWGPKSRRASGVWWAFAAALGLMALRRVTAVAGMLAAPDVSPTRATEEILAVVISVLMLIGVLRLRRLWAESDASLEEATLREAALKQSEELWQRIFEYAPDGYILLELDGRLERLNIAAAEIAGVPRITSEGRHIFELGILDEEGMTQAARNLAMLQEGQDPGPAEYTFHRSDGINREVEIIGYMIEVRSRPLLLTIVHDVTRRRRIEAELRRNRLRLEEAQRVAGIVTFEIDLRAGTMWTSGDPHTETQGADDTRRMTLEEGFSFINAEDRQRVAMELAAAASMPDHREVVVEYRQRDDVRDREATVRTTARAETDEAGNVVRMIGATLDITDMREAEHEIRTLNTALEERVRARTAELERAVDELGAFSYSVSHDLRSPLRAMAGYSDMVLEEDGRNLSETSRQHLTRIRASSVRMAGLIDGLLSLSRLTRATRTDTSVDLSEIARGIVHELGNSDPGRVVEVEIQDGLEAVADAGMMSLVLQNLLSNAWKFTRSTTRAQIAFGRTSLGAYFVRDNGVGFDASQKAKLFRPFERLHRTDEFEGTGIGLATVDRIVRHHGGRVWAEGSIGRGSTFWFTLAPAEAHLAARPHGDEPEKNGVW
ncbi:MAG: ATP-binding protein [Candidatus Binatia bacterium]